MTSKLLRDYLYLMLSLLFRHLPFTVVLRHAKSIYKENVSYQMLIEDTIY